MKYKSKREIFTPYPLINHISNTTNVYFYIHCKNIEDFLVYIRF